MSCDTTNPTILHVCHAKTQINLSIPPSPIRVIKVIKVLSHKQTNTYNFDQTGRMDRPGLISAVVEFVF